MKATDIKCIDVAFDFTTDTPRFWYDFWKNNSGLGSGRNDPDSASITLQKYHQLLWSKPLPNGAVLQLIPGQGKNYLTWGDFRFGSDSITASFRYERNRAMLERVADMLDDYKSFMEGYIRKTYTIGGSIIFPKRYGGINQQRGFNPQIRDRWDLTLECIRRYYNNETSPLYDVLVGDKCFFDLFLDFKDYVDFFYLQDCVSNDYNTVNYWLGNEAFASDPLPQSPEEYLHWIEKELDFVKKRNARIQKAIKDFAGDNNSFAFSNRR